jgi:PPOX class probable FMN-dependent enzyme
MSIVSTLDELEKIYGQPGSTSLVKEIAHISLNYRAIIEASPFAALATVGPEGMDCSPRGDRAGQLVRIVDETTIIMPDRRGNNRIDSLRNIVRDPRVALLFLIPGSGNALRINGMAQINVSTDLLNSFAVDGKAPRSVIVISVSAIYFQCARAIVRSGLWDPILHVDPKMLPSAGQILADLSNNLEGGPDYDAGWAERAKKTMW